jgi:HlyD family secretion protein
MKVGRWVLAVVVVAAAGVLGWRAVRPVAVPLTPVAESPLVQTLVFSGRVAAPIRVELGATVTGRVVEVPVREGDSLRPGDLMARLESSELQAQLGQAQAALRLAEARLTGVREVGVPTSGATLDQAQAALDAAQREAGRSRDLFERGYVSQARIDDTERGVLVAQAQLAAARAGARANAAGGTEATQARLRVEEARAAVALVQARLTQTQITAPTAGRVVTRLTDPGQIVQPGRALFTFAAAGATQLIGQADEKFLAQLAPGQAAQVVVDAFPQQPFSARLARIAPGVDAQRGTVEVRFEVAEPPAFLREDMSLSLQVAVGRRERALTLPAPAVIGSGVDARVRRLADGRVVEQPVRTGLRTLEQVEIVEGLAAGDQVLADPLGVESGVRARAATGREAAAMRPTRGGGGGDGVSAAMGAAAPGR